MADKPEFTYTVLLTTKNVKLWKFFAFKSKDRKSIWNEGKDKPFVYCHVNGCKKLSVTCHDKTTNMACHLSSFHTKENATYLSSSVPTLLLSSPLASFLSKKTLALTDQWAKTITRLIVNLFVIDLWPISIVSGALFKEMMAHAYPDYSLASHTYCAARINDWYTIKSVKLIKLFKDLESVAITTDLWTSMAHRAYLGITLRRCDFWTVSRCRTIGIRPVTSQSF